MLEQLAGDDDVEARVVERNRLVNVGPTGLDAELRRGGERIAVCVDTDDVVPHCIRTRERAVTTAEIEHASAGAADITSEQRNALRPGEDEACAALESIVLGVPLAELLQSDDVSVPTAEVHSAS